MLQELLGKSICLVVFHGFPKIPAFVGYIFRYHSFILQTGATQSNWRCSIARISRLSRKIPKTFQGLLRCLFFCHQSGPLLYPPTPPKIKINMSPEKEPFQKETYFQPSFFRGHVGFWGEYQLDIRLMNQCSEDPNECKDSVFSALGFGKFARS